MILYPLRTSKHQIQNTIQQNTIQQNTTWSEKLFENLQNSTLVRTQPTTVI